MLEGNELEGEFSKSFNDFNVLLEKSFAFLIFRYFHANYTEYPVHLRISVLISTKKLSLRVNFHSHAKGSKNCRRL